MHFRRFLKVSKAYSRLLKLFFLPLEALELLIEILKLIILLSDAIPIRLVLTNEILELSSLITEFQVKRHLVLES